MLLAGWDDDLVLNNNVLFFRIQTRVEKQNRGHVIGWVPIMWCHPPQEAKIIWLFWTWWSCWEILKVQYVRLCHLSSYKGNLSQWLLTATNCMLPLYILDWRLLATISMLAQGSVAVYNTNTGALDHWNKRVDPLLRHLHGVSLLHVWRKACSWNATHGGNKCSWEHYLLCKLNFCIFVCWC